MGVRSRALRCVVIALAVGVVVSPSAGAADNGDGFHRVTVDDVPCRPCGRPVPVGIALDVPAGWKRSTWKQMVTWTSPNRRPSAAESFSVSPLNGWSDTGLPSPAEAEAFVRSLPLSKARNVTAQSTTVGDGIQAVMYSFDAKAVHSAVYLLPTTYDFPRVVAIGFYGYSTDPKLDLVIDRVMRSVALTT